MKKGTRRTEPVSDDDCSCPDLTSDSDDGEEDPKRGRMKEGTRLKLQKVLRVIGTRAGHETGVEGLRVGAIIWSNGKFFLVEGTTSHEGKP